LIVSDTSSATSTPKKNKFLPCWHHQQQLHTNTHTHTQTLKKSLY
jgi:hypothetical protein